MKLILSILSLALMAFSGKHSEFKTSDKSIQISVPDDLDNVDIKVYYFFGTHRCETCQAVERVSRKVVTKDYPDIVEFEAYNREMDENKNLVEKYQVSGQTLLVVKGDEIVDLTNEAFMYARNSPDRLKKKIRETIDAMLAS